METFKFEISKKPLYVVGFVFFALIVGVALFDLAVNSQSPFWKFGFQMASFLISLKISSLLHRRAFPARSESNEKKEG